MSDMANNDLEKYAKALDKFVSRYQISLDLRLMFLPGQS